MQRGGNVLGGGNADYVDDQRGNNRAIDEKGAMIVHFQSTYPRVEFDVYYLARKREKKGLLSRLKM